MRSHLELPPVLRGAMLVGLLCLVLSFGVLSSAFGSALPALLGLSLGLSSQPWVLSWHAQVTGMSLTLLSVACTCVVGAYRLRVRQPGSPSALVHSWQRQFLALGLLAALPLTSLTLALVLPETPLDNFVLSGTAWLTIGSLLVGARWAATLPTSRPLTH